MLEHVFCNLYSDMIFPGDVYFTISVYMRISKIYLDIYLSTIYLIPRYLSTIQPIHGYLSTITFYNWISIYYTFYNWISIYYTFSTWISRTPAAVPQPEIAPAH